MSQEFSLTSEVKDNCLVIATAGYVNNAGGEAIVKEFTKYFESGTKYVVINLANSKVVNSIGMSFLIDIIDQLNNVNGKLVFTDVDPAVDKMLSIMGLFRFAGKERSVNDALQQLSTR